MGQTFVNISQFSILLAAIAACIQYRRVEGIYHPIFWLVWIGLLNESISFTLNYNGISNARNANIYSLIESMIIPYFFKRMGLFARKPGLYYGILSLFILVWITENIVFSRFALFDSYFVIIVSLTYVFMSIRLINRLILTETTPLARHPVFLLCLGWSVYYTYGLLVEIFWIYGLNSSREFLHNVYDIMTVINFLTNILYFIAILWIPRKREYTLL